MDGHHASWPSQQTTPGGGGGKESDSQYLNIKNRQQLRGQGEGDWMGEWVAG
jgi:hypothetical protein